MRQSNQINFIDAYSNSQSSGILTLYCCKCIKKKKNIFIGHQSITPTHYSNPEEGFKTFNAKYGVKLSVLLKMLIFK